MGLVQLGKHMIKVLDLHQQLSSSGLPQSPGNQSFLVIMRDSQGELCGILVDEPPDLVELPLEMIRSLPSDRYGKPAIEMVSHVAVLSQEEVTKTIFLLDIKRILNPVMNDSQPRIK